MAGIPAPSRWWALLGVPGAHGEGLTPPSVALEVAAWLAPGHLQAAKEGVSGSGRTVAAGKAGPSHQEPAGRQAWTGRWLVVWAGETGQGVSWPPASPEG